jgi:hypothetical protein
MPHDQQNRPTTFARLAKRHDAPLAELLKDRAVQTNEAFFPDEMDILDLYQRSFPPFQG